MVAASLLRIPKGGGHTEGGEEGSMGCVISPHLTFLLFATRNLRRVLGVLIMVPA